MVSDRATRFLSDIDGRGTADVELTIFLSLARWNVNYGHLAFDDAQRCEGVWYYRDLITGEIVRFESQDRVVPIGANDTIKPKSENTSTH